ncbi:hypothetical protein [Protofrankia symbiont of Coriaria ruscifolia]|uniref:hypothetical protein n=1 Tax=Protofrankia symbiont of Coriaria ruscifolia TaxID=1306542 RepID=UPI0010411FBA|nr:hypothetical protein [Protofrankia symbiont of Coriaria ruscifolia]
MSPPRLAEYVRRAMLRSEEAAHASGPVSGGHMAWASLVNATAVTVALARLPALPQPPDQQALPPTTPSRP